MQNAPYDDRQTASYGPSFLSRPPSNNKMALSQYAIESQLSYSFSSARGEQSSANDSALFTEKEKDKRATDDEGS